MKVRVTVEVEVFGDKDEKVFMIRYIDDLIRDIIGRRKDERED